MKKQKNVEPIKEQTIHRIENERQLMSFSKWLGQKKIRIRIGIGIGIFLFLILQFFLNTIGRFFSTGEFGVKIWYIFVPYMGRYAGWIYLILILFCTVIGGYEYYKITVNFREENIGQKGTRRFTTLEEIKNQYKAIPDRDVSFPGKGGIPIARIGKTLYVDDSVTNSIILGITRSGKGEMFVIPTIDALSRGNEKPSIVVTDMKKELFPMCYQPLCERGYMPLLFDLDNPTHGIQFNPLNNVIQLYKEGDIPGAELLAQSYAYSVFMQEKSDPNADFFLDNATAALTAAILAHIDDCLREDRRINTLNLEQWLNARKRYQRLEEEQQVKVKARYQAYLQGEERTAQEILSRFPALPPEANFIPCHENEKCITMDSITHTFLELGRVKINSQTTQLDLYFNKRDEFDRAKALYASIEVSGDRTKGSIFSQALSKMSIYNFADISRLTAESTFDLTDLGFGNKPIALFISVPLHDRSKDAIVSTLYSQIFQMNTRKAAQMPNKKCNRLIVNLWDEIGNFPPVKDLDTMVSIGLGINVLYILVLQSYNQLDDKYGAAAQTIKDNCGNHIYIQTVSWETAEHFSKLVGNQTITNVTRSGKHLDTNKTVTEIYEERPLLRPDELMGLQEEECVIVRGMKRRDNEGNPIVPYPIFNSRASGTNLIYRYKYLQDTFRDGVNIKDCHVPEIEAFDMRKRNFQTETVFNEFRFRELRVLFQQINAGKISVQDAFGDDEDMVSSYLEAIQELNQLEEKYFCNLFLEEAYPEKARMILKNLKEDNPDLNINMQESLAQILWTIYEKSVSWDLLQKWIESLLSGRKKRERGTETPEATKVDLTKYGVLQQEDRT